MTGVPLSRVSTIYLFSDCFLFINSVKLVKGFERGFTSSPGHLVLIIIGKLSWLSVLEGSCEPSKRVNLGLEPKLQPPFNGTAERKKANSEGDGNSLVDQLHNYFIFTNKEIFIDLLLDIYSFISS